MIPQVLCFIVFMFHGIAENEDGTCSSAFTCAAEALPKPVLHVDSYVTRAYQQLQDPSCKIKEYKVADNSSVRDALAAFSRCRGIVIRELLPARIAETFSERFAEWLLDVRDGSAAGSCNGSTHNDASWAQRLDDKGQRWEILIPQRLATADIVSAAPIETLMSKGLGKEFVLHSAGVVTANPGTEQGEWHHDSPFLWDGRGISAHDVPPYAVTLAIALSDAPAEMGPTELCIGSSWINGFDFESEYKQGRLSPEYASLLNQVSVDGCPEAAARRTNLRIGDAIMWDYSMLHRGGPNLSNRTRALLYLTYSLPWFRDENFQTGKLYQQDVVPTRQLEQRLYRARLALSPIISSRLDRTPKPLWSLTEFGAILEESDSC